MGTYMNSLELLESVSAAAIYPSHGPASPNGKPVLQYFIKHRQEREQQLLNALGTAPRSQSQLVQEVYDDVDASIWPLAEHSLRAGLIKLIEEGKCEQVGEEYRALT